jgi:hypothetical protein
MLSVRVSSQWKWASANKHCRGGCRHSVGDGETDPAALAALADQRLRATPEQLRDAFGVCADLHPVFTGGW